MDITGEAIQKIVDISKPETHEIKGETYSDKQLFPLPLPHEPAYPTMQIHTLNGLVDFVKDNYQNPLMAGQVIIGAMDVKYVGPERGLNRRRDIYAAVTCKAVPFRFGVYQDLELFRVGLMTQFEESGHRESLLQFLSKITDEAIKTLADNGVTQRMEAKVGIASVGNVDVPSPARLSPIRTFVEIDQPEGVFIFRIKKGPAGPEAALIEIFTDWERTAVEAIKEYFKHSELPEDVPVYA